MSWMITADKLVEEQRHFIFNTTREKDKIWIKGFAGSGKSILLVHTIQDKIKENPNVSICVVVFTHSLIQMFSAGMQELKIPYKNVYLTTYPKFRKENQIYDYIFCDEVQDLTKSVLENMKSRTNHLIVAGDENQSIYKEDPYSHEPTVTPSEIGLIINITPYELKGIHRLTKTLINAINKFLPNMRIFEAKVFHPSEGDISVRLCQSHSKEKEVAYILEQANMAIDNSNQSVAVILPTHNEIAEFINMVLALNNIESWEKEQNLNNWGKPNYSRLHQYLQSTNVNIEYIGNGYGDLYATSQNNKIVLMTYHSVKGLDFDNVFLPFLYDRDTWFSENVFTKTLFMVGLSRSKNNLYITYTGAMHHYITSFKNECVIIDIDSIKNDSNDDVDFDF